MGNLIRLGRPEATSPSKQNRKHSPKTFMEPFMAEHKKHRPLATPLTRPCPAGTCRAGTIGNKEVIASEWAVESLKFDGMIELWNETTKCHAIPHIGDVHLYKFCPDCGSSIDTSFIQGGNPELRLSEDLKQILSLPEEMIAEQGALLLNAGRNIPSSGMDQRVAVQHWLMKQYFLLGRGWREKTDHLIASLAVAPQDP
jgi:hypothetical protein